MNPTQANHLAERFREAPGWTWMPGMLCASGERTVRIRSVSGVVLLIEEGDFWHADDDVAAKDAVPLLTDPTTSACILWLISERNRTSRAREVKALMDAVPARMMLDRNGTADVEWDAATQAVLRHSGAVAAYYSHALATITSDGWTFDFYRAALACLEAT